MKLVLAVAAILALSLTPVGGYAAFAVSWLAIVVSSRIAGIGGLRTSRGAFIAAPFLLAAVPLVFTRTAEPIGSFTLGPWLLTASAEGLRIVLSIALRSWLSVQVALLLAFTTAFPDLLEGLGRLRLPRLLVEIIGLMYRYLAVLTDEAERILRARAARSALPAKGGGGPLRWRAAVAGGMVGSLFLRSYERSERVYAAMQARGYDGTARVLAGRPLTGAERAALVLGLAALVAFEAAAQVWLPRG